MATQVSLTDGAVASAGALAIQTNGTTQAVSISTGQVATLAQNPILTSGTANGVVYLNGSKAATSGSALVFDGATLGVGVTPSSWGGSGVKALDVAVSTSIAGSAGSADMYGNAYYNGSNFVFKANGYAFRYQQNIGSGFHAWSTSNNGTAGGTPSFTQAMTLDASGNLGLGVTPSNAWAGTTSIESQSFNLNSISTSDVRFMQNAYYNVSTAAIYTTTNAASMYRQASGAHQWFNAPSGTAGTSLSWTQAMTLDTSGNLLVGTTSNAVTNSNSVVVLPAYGQINYQHASGTSSGANYAYFAYNGSGIGSITQNGTTGVLYNLTSDYRLKNDQQPLTGAKEFVMALQPKKWQWWDGSGEGVGFIAHEFMEVAKYSGNGEKDAVDADGKPVYQSIQPSSSEVMANLVAFIQEQQSLIVTMRDEIDALKVRVGT